MDAKTVEKGGAEIRGENGGSRIRRKNVISRLVRREREEYEHKKSPKHRWRERMPKPTPPSDYIKSSDAQDRPRREALDKPHRIFPKQFEGDDRSTARDLSRSELFAEAEC